MTPQRFAAFLIIGAVGWLLLFLTFVGLFTVLGWWK